jgi:hypothetical protein
MVRDPFYQHIIDRLNRRLDPELFERCASDLLRTVHPTLVPIRGGTDAGMDGAIADGDGLPFPLVCTTGKGVLRNLKRSLASYVKRGGKRRSVVLATSRELTQRQRANCERAAAQVGFTLVQTHTQASIAGLLYRNPQWCAELLNLPSDPPPLAVQPLTDRPLTTQPLVSREEDLAWLGDTPGDLLLVGQPGAGKTCLLHALALQGAGLFVVSCDRGQIAAAIRSQEPKLLFVDEANLFPSLITQLRQMRSEMGAAFRIVATCWPGEQDAVARLLAIGSDGIRSLRLLNRDQIAEIIHRSGIGGPDDLINELINQAAGRPGLAVTLCYLCLKGDVREVILGDALCRDTRTTFQSLVGAQATTILAAFAVGGDRGMPMQVVARCLGLSDLEVHDKVKRLAAGGVLLETDYGTLAVHPATLRHALVRDVFYCGAASLMIDQLLAHAPGHASATRTLIGARARGAQVSHDLFRSRLAALCTVESLNEYAQLGSRECCWALETYPDRLIDLAEVALHFVPDTAIPRLLALATGDERPLHQHPRHPLRILADWVQGALPGTPRVLERRRALLAAALHWLRSGGHLTTGLAAVRFALSAAYEEVRPMPGSGLTIQLRSGVVTPDEAKAIHALWPQALSFLRTRSLEDWKPVQQLVEQWAFPGRMNAPIGKAHVKALRSIALRMLRDVVSLARGHPGVQQWAAGVAALLKARVRTYADRQFAVLFPAHEPGRDWQERQRRQEETAAKLAGRWSGDDPASVVERLLRFEREAAFAGRRWPRWSPAVCAALAERVEAPVAWLDALLEGDGPGDLIHPFLERVVRSRQRGWRLRLRTCLARPGLRPGAVSTILQMSQPPRPLLDHVLANLDCAAGLVEMLCLHEALPEERLGQLLRHQDLTVAGAAARGMWHAQPGGAIPTGVQQDWRDAVIRGVEEDHTLIAIFRAQPVLAAPWLERRLRENGPGLYLYDEAVPVAVEMLRRAERQRLLTRIPEHYRHDELVSLLVGTDSELCRQVLQDERLRHHHLALLHGRAEGAWPARALLALDVGYSPAQVAEATYGGALTWSGSEADMWAGWMRAFESLLSHDDPRLRRVAQIGYDRAKAEYERALAREQREDIYGQH